MRVSGRSPDGKFVEIAELPSHPWFVAVQFHPEFQSQAAQAAPAVCELRRGGATGTRSGKLEQVGVSELSAHRSDS